MTTGSLALIITTLLTAQAVVLLLSGYYRSWRQRQHCPQLDDATAAAHPIDFSHSGRQTVWQPGGDPRLDSVDAEAIEVRQESLPDTDTEIGRCLPGTARPKSDLVLQL